MLRYARYSKFLTIASMASLFGSGTMYNIASTFGYNIRLFTNITDIYDRTLNMQSYYIYDYSKTPIYELTYFFQSLCACLMLYIFSLVISYFGSLIFHLTGQFEILAIEFEKLMEINVKNATAEKNEQEFNRTLGALITKHVSLIRSIEKLNNRDLRNSKGQCCFRSLNQIELYFNKVMLIQLLTTYTGVCCGTLMIVYVSTDL